MNTIWTYLILFGLFLLFTKKKKKKGSADAPRQPRPELDEPWPDLEVTVEPKEAAHPTPQAMQPRRRTSAEASQSPRTASKPPAVSPYTTGQNVSRRAPYSPTSPPSSPPILDPNDTQAVRRAFLLSEIINRKYI